MRIRYFDIAKGIGMVLVVLSHTCPMGIGIQGFCESFHMPMFFFISGYFFSLDKYSLKDFFKRRFLQLVLPLVSFSILVGTLNSFSQTCFKISNYIFIERTYLFLELLMCFFSYSSQSCLTSSKSFLPDFLASSAILT